MPLLFDCSLDGGKQWRAFFAIARKAFSYKATQFTRMLPFRIASVAWNANAKAASEAMQQSMLRNANGCSIINYPSIYRDAISQKENKERFF